MLSVCMIVRNEAKALPSLLKNISAIATEIVVVDTGSTDRSKKILKKHPKVRLHSFTWCDDFAAARNTAIEHAREEWILMLDADERLERAEDILLLIDNEEVDAYNLRIINLQPPNSLTKFEIDYLPRLFRNKGYRYHGLIHEQISPSLEQKNAKRKSSNVSIIHHGYQSDVSQGESRWQRNLPLLQKQVEQSPDDFYPLYQLALAYKVKDEARSQQLFMQTLEIGGRAIPKHLEAQIHMRLAQLAFSKNEYIKVINHAQHALSIDADNVIARVCLITSLCSIRAFAQAAEHIRWIVQYKMDVVGNPEDFVALHNFVESQGF